MPPHARRALDPHRSAFVSEGPHVRSSPPAPPRIPVAPIAYPGPTSIGAPASESARAERRKKKSKRAVKRSKKRGIGKIPTSGSKRSARCATCAACLTRFSQRRALDLPLRTDAWTHERMDAWTDARSGSKGRMSRRLCGRRESRLRHGRTRKDGWTRTPAPPNTIHAPAPRTR